MRPTGGMGYRGMSHMGNSSTGGMGYKGDGPHRQWVTWPMGHMGNGAYGPWGLWAMGPMGDWHIFAHSIIITGWILTKILLNIDINVFYLNIPRFFHDGFILMHISDGFQIELVSAPCSDRPHYIFAHAHFVRLRVGLVRKSCFPG